MVCHCIRRQCFILLPNVWVIFKIYFAILHKIVTINNVQQSIKQAKGFFFKFLHYIWLAMLHNWVICFEHMAAWKRCSDMRKVCGNIFEDRKRCNVQQMFIRDLVKTSSYTIFILVYAKSFKSMGMLAYRARFCYAVDLKFVQMLS